MAENRNKLRGTKSKAPVIYTAVICGLLGLVFIFYATYAYLGYIRLHNITEPGISDIMDALGTLFTEDSFKLPITFEVIQEVLVMQVRDIWWVYVGIALAIFLMMTSRNPNDYRGMEHGSARWADSAADNLISQALDNGELSSFSRRAAGADHAVSSSVQKFSSAPDISDLNFNSFTGQTTDLSYFSQSDTMPLSAIRNIGDENIKEAVKQNFDKAAQQGLIELDGDNIRITAKGKDYISQPDFVKAAQADQTAAYQKSVAKMASANTAENEVQMCVGLRGNYFNDFSVFNHTDSIDLSTVINHPDKKTAKQILSNVKKWQSGGFVTVKDGVATITQNGKAVLASAGFKAASVPLTEGTVAAVGNVPGAVIVVTKKVAAAAVKAIQTGAVKQKR